MGAALLAAFASSCAFYNTFYLARKYYFKATDGAPYEVDRQSGAGVQNYTRSIDYSKKVMGQYPRSKWVDDAYLLWAKDLLGRDDPLQTITMLENFPVQFPRSDLKPDAQFFLGLAYRSARKYTQAVSAFDDYLLLAPKHSLVPYAHYERARALMSLKRYAEAGDAAGQVLAHFPRHTVAPRALRQRAEARLQQGDFVGARADFHSIGTSATSDAERFDFFMREVDCLESAREFDAELALLKNELSHTPPPAVLLPGQLPATGADRYGRLTMRVGTAHLLAGRMRDAIEQYEHVLTDYPKTALGAEAQYRIAFAYETSGEDFERALQEYGRVRDQFGASNFTMQAQSRSDDLGRIMQYRKGTGADSLEKKAEAGFLTAERYLFQQDKPERAFEEYGQVVREYPGTAVAGRALNAQAWVLRRKLGRDAASDSLLWRVIHEYPATEAQVAARDYLEAAGHTVPDSLIKLPSPKVVAPDTTLTPIPPPEPLHLNPAAITREDSLQFIGRARGRIPNSPGDSLMMRDMRSRYPDDPRFQYGPPRDSLGNPINPYPPRSGLPPVPPPADTTRNRGSR